MMTIIKNKINQDSDKFFNTLKGILRYGVFGIAGLFAGYLYLVGALTFSVIQQRELAESLHAKNSEISQSEISYLQKEKGMTKDFATNSLGLVHTTNIAYTQGASDTALAFNAN